MPLKLHIQLTNIETSPAVKQPIKGGRTLPQVAKLSTLQNTYLKSNHYLGAYFSTANL